MAILDNNTLEFVSNSLEQTIRLGIRLGELLQPGDTLCLHGEMGSGKTALARGIGRGWGTSLRVTSPTYIVVNEYPRSRDGAILYHIDCYRLRSEVDAITAGLLDIVESGSALLIEWPELIDDWIPAERLTIALKHTDSTRRSMRIQANGERHAAILQSFRRSAFTRR